MRLCTRMDRGGLYVAAQSPGCHTHDDQAGTIHYERMGATVQWLNGLLHLIDTDRQKYAFEPERIEFADEIETFRRVTGYAVNEDTLIPGISRLSLRKLQQDAEWLNAVDGTSPTERSGKVGMDLNSLSMFARGLLGLLCFLMIDTCSQFPNIFSYTRSCTFGLHNRPYLPYLITLCDVLDDWLSLLFGIACSVAEFLAASLPPAFDFADPSPISLALSLSAEPALPDFSLSAPRGLLPNSPLALTIALLNK